MLSDKELKTAQSCLEMALDAGADKVRVTLNRSEENLVATLNSEVDRVTRCCDSSPAGVSALSPPTRWTKLR